jgi:hypothetical protein
MVKAFCGALWQVYFALALCPQNFLLLHLFYTSADGSAPTLKKISEMDVVVDDDIDIRVA